MLTERQFQILKSSIESYLTENETIASKDLADEYAMSPSMMRYELAKLDEEGYLHQPHTSAGRIPTDKALKWFVEHFVFTELEFDRVNAFFDRHFTGGEKEYNVFDELVSAAAERCGGLSNMRLGNISFRAGFDDLFSHFEELHESLVRSIVRDVEYLDRRIEEFEGGVPDDFIDVFIGNESPLTESNELAVIAAKIPKIEGGGMFVFLGSRRMPYKRNVAFVEAARNFLNGKYGERSKR